MQHFGYRKAKITFQPSTRRACAIILRAIINGVPFAFLHNRGANQTYMNENTVREQGLGYLIRKKPKDKCVDVETAGPKDTKTHHYIEADMVFHGATHKTYNHIISGLKDKRVLLLHTDITCPKSRNGWVRREAKAEKANGLFRSIYTEGNNVYVTHTFPKESVALAVAKTLACQYIAAETTIPLYHCHPPGNIWPEITAPKASSHALRNQLWTVIPVMVLISPLKRQLKVRSLKTKSGVLRHPSLPWQKRMWTRKRRSIISSHKGSAST
jgi:hypothetical protein